MVELLKLKKTIRTLVTYQTYHKTQPLSCRAGHLQTPNPHSTSTGHESTFRGNIKYFARFLQKDGKDPAASSPTLAGQDCPNTKAAAPTPHIYMHSLSWQCPTVSLLQLILKKASPLCNHKCRWGDRQYCGPSPVSCPGNPMTTLAHRVIVIHSAKWVGPKLPSSNITLPCKWKRKACYAPHTRPTVCKVSISGLLRTLFG